MIDLEENGEQIGKKLFTFLSTKQKKELIEYVKKSECNKTGVFDVSYSNICSKSLQDIMQSLTEVTIGEVYFCQEQRIVTVRNQMINLTIKEFDILALLIMHPKRVFTYEMLMELVWHEDYTFYSRKAINNHMSNLRKKLKIAPDIPDYVKSVYGVGYKFEV